MARNFVPHSLALGVLLAVGLVAINVGYVASSLGFIHGPEAVSETDHYHYLLVTQHFLGSEGDPTPIYAPYAYRLLVPLLAVGLTRLGLSPDASYYLLSNFFLTLFLVTLFVYLRDLGFDRKLTTVGVIFAGLMQGAVRWYEYQYWMSDPACLFFVALGFLLIHRGQFVPLVCLSAIAVTARETYLIIIGYYFLHTSRRIGFKSAVARTTLLAILPVSVLIALRLGVPTANSSRGQLVAVVENMIAFRSANLFKNQLYVLTVGSLGVLFPLLLLYPKEILHRIRSSYDEAAVIGAVYLSLLLGNNTDRLLVYALPAMLPPALRNLQRCFQDHSWRLNAFVALALGVQVLFFFQIRLYEKHVSVFQPVNFVVIGAMFLFWALGMAFGDRSDGERRVQVAP
jgi:hypothetical protein